MREGLEVLQSIKTAGQLVAGCARLYVELALSVTELLPSAVRRERDSEEIFLATGS
jgi:hypothetical protein